MELTREQAHKMELEKQYKADINLLKNHGEAYLYNCLRRKNLNGKVFGMKVTEYVEMLKKDLAQKNKK